MQSFRARCVGPYKKWPDNHDVPLNPDGAARSKARQAPSLSPHPSAESAISHCPSLEFRADAIFNALIPPANGTIAARCHVGDGPFLNIQADTSASISSNTLFGPHTPHTEAGLHLTSFSRTNRVNLMFKSYVGVISSEGPRQLPMGASHGYDDTIIVA
jgi:hypothetical protein